MHFCSINSSQSTFVLIWASKFFQLIGQVLLSLRWNSRFIYLTKVIIGIYKHLFVYRWLYFSWYKIWKIKDAERRRNIGKPNPCHRNHKTMLWTISNMKLIIHISFLMTHLVSLTIFSVFRFSVSRITHIGEMS